MALANTQVVPEFTKPDASGYGLVSTQYYTPDLGDEGFALECGRVLPSLTIAYETYGQLSPEADNAILIAHALSGDAHVAGIHSANDSKAGWWDITVGPNKPFDTTKYFIICANVLGGCKGTTGPSSIDPASGRPYGVDFPQITIGDMVRAEKLLIDHLGIERLLAVAGGSMGGFQALDWAVRYPDSVASVLAIGTSARLSTQAIAFNEVGRQAIMADPDWAEGDYYDKPFPGAGLSIARMIGHITYLSDEQMHAKFGRRLQDREDFGYDFGTDFQVESYLRYQGSSFVGRFDANSYLYISKAMDYFDLASGYESLVDALSRTTARFLVISFTSDWLFPTYQAREIVTALQANGNETTFLEIPAAYGHDSFLLPNERQASAVGAFLATTISETRDEGTQAARSATPAAVGPGQLRPDYDLIQTLVTPGSKVLDLGCGDGQLLERLSRNQQCQCRGVEIDESLVLDCIRRGINVHHGDMLEGMADYQDDAFDVVVLSQTLQQTSDPRQVILEMLRVGKTAIISFRNMGHWSARWHLLMNGSMPINSRKPYDWYNSPNNHLCTVTDFEKLCVREGWPIARTVFLASSGRRVPGRIANLMADLALFQITREG